MRLLRSEVADGPAPGRTLRELVEALEKLLYLGSAVVPLLGARVVEVAPGGPQTGDGRAVFSRSGRGSLTRDIALVGGTVNLIPNPLDRAPQGRVLTWQSASGALLDRDPAALSPVQDPAKWIALAPSADMTIRLMVY